VPPVHKIRTPSLIKLNLKIGRFPIIRIRKRHMADHPGASALREMFYLSCSSIKGREQLTLIGRDIFGW